VTGLAVRPSVVGQAPGRVDEDLGALAENGPGEGPAQAVERLRDGDAVGIGDGYGLIVDIIWVNRPRLSRVKVRVKFSTSVWVRT